MNINTINFANLSNLSNFSIRKKKNLLKCINNLKNDEIKLSIIKISNLADLNYNDNNIKIIKNDLELKLNDIDNLINNLKYKESYSN